MWKNQRIFIVLLAIIMVTTFLTGCNANSVKFEGVNSKKFTKDLTSLRGVVLDSLKSQEYKEDDVDKILDKMNTEKYTKKLSDKEQLLLQKINVSKSDLKNDLNDTGMISDRTYSDMNWFLQLSE